MFIGVGDKIAVWAIASQRPVFVAILYHRQRLSIQMGDLIPCIRPLDTSIIWQVNIKSFVRHLEKSR